jgi:two-component system response regulator AtoC
MNENKLQALIVDDELNLRASLVELVEGENFTAREAANGEEAINLLRRGAASPDVIFLDIRMPKMDGLTALRLMREERLTSAPVIVISAFGDSAKTIEAMRLGAYDYITKPLDLDEITQTLHRAAAQRRSSLEAERARAAQKENASVANGESSARQTTIIGASRAMREVFKQIGRVSATDATVLITGESGTGKELVARAIHDHSVRAQRPFIAVNCGALPENLIETELFGHERGAFTGADRQKKGRFELAHTGTLFLDEIGELAPSAQVKLLRALQERRFERIGGAQTVSVDVRVIAATNRDLRREIEARRFREDLFYRLSVIEVHLPSLRARLADVPQLAEYFTERASLRHSLPPRTLSDAAMRALLAYDFPGNVRELENMIERAVVTSGADVILPEHLFGDSTREAKIEASTNEQFLEMPFKEAVAALERELIRRALEAAGGNRAEAARRLGINRRLLYSKLEEHKLA